MGLRITDCTIRDGGYLFEKNSPPDFVKGILQGLADAGIDFVETGFLQAKVNGENLVYSNSVDARRYIPAKKGHTEFIGFCDNSRYSVDHLDDYDGRSFKWLRISFAKHELDEAVLFCEAAQNKGYIVQFNPMDVLSYSETEIEMMINRVNDIVPGSLSIVDTFGAMYLEEMERLFLKINNGLDKSIAIGLHSHDNLGLSTALAERLCVLANDADRDVICDGSLLGMGRGAGNACTELLADYMNKHFGKNYRIDVLVKTIEEYIIPVMEKIKWGYDLPMFICGMFHSHVDNVYHMLKNGYRSEEMIDIMQRLEPSQLTRYGKGYSKTDFSALDNICRDYHNDEVNN